jgi:hypothetical protein
MDTSMNKDEAIKLALDVIKNLPMGYSMERDIQSYKAILACEQALKQPEQDEPVAWVVYDTARNDIAWTEAGKQLKAETPLYASPPKRQWQGLTEDELSEVYNQADWNIGHGWEYERAIEAKLRSKNT